MFESFVFSGGEVQTKLSLNNRQPIKLIHRIQSSDNLMALMMAGEILNRSRPPGKSAIIPYFPYARQDRITEYDVAFSLKVAAHLINLIGFDEVVSCDVHSDVTPALVNHMRVISQFDIVTKHYPALYRQISDSIDVIVAPDAGAYKKASAIARFFKLPLVIGHKVRDVATGEITHTEVEGTCLNKNCMIVDDICDGGKTFTELAKALRNAGAQRVELYVTHGIFSKGYEVFAGLIDRIWTTDTFIPKTYPMPHEVPSFTINLPYTEL